MKFRMFTVFDQKARCYIPPFFLPEVGQAMRQFADAVNDPSHHFSKHPEDYALFEVGSFDDGEGLVTSFEGPRLHSTALALVAAVNDPRPISLVEDDKEQSA